MSEVKVDTISERTTDAGVTVEGVKIEDGVATFQTAAGSPLVFEGATANAHETTFAFTDPTADRTITFPDADVTLGAAEDNTPSFSAYAASTGLSNSTYNKITAATELYDVGGCHDTTTGRFTVPAGEAGKYVVWTRSTVSNDEGIVVANFVNWMYLNGVANQKMYHGAPANSAGALTNTSSSVFDLSAADYIEWYIFITFSSGTMTLDAGIAYNSWGAFKLAGV